MPIQIELAAMSHAEKDALIFALFDWQEELEDRINKLENKIIKDSNNSNKPPTSDGCQERYLIEVDIFSLKLSVW